MLDLLVSIEAHVELWGRRLRHHGNKLRAQADRLLDEQRAKAAKLSERMPKVKSESLLFGGGADRFDRESGSREDKIEKRFRDLRLKARDNLKRVQARWEEEKTVRLRDKVPTCFPLL